MMNSQTATWLPVPDKHPTFDPVDLLLEDGSVLCGCLPQSDGDYWWNGIGGEVFIDPRYAPVTHWRLSSGTGGQAMTIDDILRMAREAGIDAWWDSGNECREDLQDHLEHFSGLIAAAEREACAAKMEKLQADHDDIVAELMSLVLCAEAKSRFEAAEKETASWKGLAKQFGNEADALRAKVKQMEQQESVGEIVAFGESLHEVSWNRGKLPPLGAKLYLLPGAQPAPSVPNGWKLVPIEPTLEMMRALIDEATQYDSWRDGYREMLAAAPEAKP